MEDLKVSIVQSDLHWQSIDANLAMFEEKIWQLEKTDVIVLPEMFTTGFTMESEVLAEPPNFKTFRWMKQIATQTQALVVGSYIIKESKNYFNRLYCVYPDGRYFQYDKRHLFSLAGESKNYTAGKKRLIIEWKGWKICPLICYDLRFPVWSRSQNYEYDLILFVANWPKPRINAWDTLLQARAIENIAYCAGVNRIGIDGYKADYSGNSAVYDFKGNTMLGPIIDEENAGTVSLSMDSLQAFRRRFDFQKEADRFTIE